MSLNLEDDPFMDDLFGDGGHVTIPPPVVSVKGLSQTLDHLASTNSCEKVAWSKYGTVAAIAPDGRSVKLYVLIKGSKSNSWNLSKPSVLPLELEEDHLLVHISWNQLGSMLSVFDSSGRISIFDTVNNTSGRMVMVRSGSKDGGIEMDAIAASYWFPVLPYAEKVCN
jgi:mediator of RNA polymerase II transcription subunit 16